MSSSDDEPTQRELDRASALESKGDRRTGQENDELQVLWLRRGLWATLKEKLRKLRGDP